ncbi:flagellar motor switch phosphatase FliY [Halanaerobium sp. Z-7514]|uniref:Flagellar motor switch phosphatase FliY n=1 Tax=Halanaerobium polyolivorans TaxID=2886943 RepID=A0AAW4X067_9FIRM|nr:flagellar motor switch phosphatase FliY [Halanaerobium polyolivorans]MCC3145195.1 flagellar motor switch phosphatase FliY [Halanaerobium polyolivorans]
MSNDGSFLSQEEIDALMNQDDESTASDSAEEQEISLNDEEKDVIGEINNIAMGSSATALSTLLDQKVSITTPKIEVVAFQKIIEEYNKPCVLVKVEYVEGIEGLSLLVIDTKDAGIIADLMMGGNGLDDMDEEMLNEISISAVGEAMNQMMGAASTAMSSILDTLVNISPPTAELIELDDVIDEGRDWFDPTEEIVVTSFNLKVGELIDSSFKQLSSYNFIKKLANSLLVGQTGLINNSTDEMQSEKREDSAKSAAEENIETEKSQQPQTEKNLGQSSSPAANTSSAQNKSGQQLNQAAEEQKSADYTQLQAEEEKIDIQSAQFPNFSESQAQPLPNNMELIKDVPLQVTVRLGKSIMKIREILDLGDGSIIELDKLAGEPVDLLVNGKLVAKGEVVVIDENFGFRVKDIISPSERLNKI